MEAVRKIIEHSSGSLTIEVPKEYDNRKLKVIVMPIDEPVNEGKNTIFRIFSGNWNGKAMR